MNKKIKHEYNNFFRRNPGTANLFLLLAELADEHGQVVTTEEQLADLMAARFNDFRAYQLSGGPKS